MKSAVRDARVTIKTLAGADIVVEGSFFRFILPAKYYSNAAVSFNNGSSSSKSIISIADISSKDSKNPFKTSANGVSIETNERNLAINVNGRTAIFFRRESENSDVEVCFALTGNKIRKGKECRRSARQMSLTERLSLSLTRHVSRLLLAGNAEPYYPAN